MRLFRLTLSIGLALLLCPMVQGQITINSGGQARLINEPSGARNDNNGGDTVGGALIGRNAGNVENFLVFDFSNLSAAAGLTVTGATIDFRVAQGFSHAAHGSVDDIINLHEMASPNVGWDRGSSAISGSDNQADDGSVSFANRVQYDTSGTTTPWLDASGGNVADLSGTFSTLGSQAGWNSGSAPALLTYNVSAATAQGWVNAGSIGGLALGVTDDGDTNSRFNFLGNGSAASNAGSITFFTAVPEPSGFALLAVAGLVGLARRRR